MKRILSMLAALVTVTVFLCFASCDFLKNPIFSESQTDHKEGGDSTADHGKPNDHLPSESPDNNTDSSDDGTTPGENGTDTHQHTYTGTWQHDSTSHWKTCTRCGAKDYITPHVSAVDEGTPATCNTPGMTNGSHCAVCRRTLEERSPIPATGMHSTVYEELLLPTLTEAGHMSGEQCIHCKTVVSSAGQIPAIENANGSHAYNELPTEAQKQFYLALYSACAAYHDNKTADAKIDNGSYIALEVSFDSYGLDSSAAFHVLRALQMDCPIFYWIDSYATARGNALYVHTIVDYADGDARSAYNEIIYRGILAFGNPGGTAYDRAFYLHDTMLDHMDYAYKANGSPETALWAHSILGYFTTGYGVCETYAETCSLILNYWGIDNYIVTGYAGGVLHAWNLIQMDNGDWYWFDLTWDDQPTAPLGRDYDFFCKTDAAFFAEHSRTVDGEYFTLPARGTTAPNGSTPAPGTDISYLGYVFTVAGYNELELTTAPISVSLSIPGEVTYAGTTYRVASIGNLDESNNLRPVIQSGTVTLHIPSTVECIRGNALSCNTLTSVSVASESPYLMVEGGTAIYQKEPCILICYLITAEDAILTLREDTVGIARWAILNNNRLTTIVIPIALTYLEEYAVYGISSVTIAYCGTSAQWADIKIEDNALPAYSLTYVKS